MSHYLACRVFGIVFANLVVLVSLSFCGGNLFAVVAILDVLVFRVSRCRFCVYLLFHACK